MTVQSKTAARPSTVTTGPIAGSQQDLHLAERPARHRVPFREIALDPSAREAPYRAYDTSGPYTDPAVTIDLEAGLPPVRARLDRQARLRAHRRPRGEARGQWRRLRRPPGAALPGGASGARRQARPAGHAV